MVHKYIRKLRSFYKVQQSRILWHRKMFIIYYINKSRVQKHLWFHLTFLTWNGKRDHVESERQWQRDKEAERRKYIVKLNEVPFCGRIFIIAFSSFACVLIVYDHQISIILWFFKELFFRPKNVYVGEGKKKQSRGSEKVAGDQSRISHHSKVECVAISRKGFHGEIHLVNNLSLVTCTAESRVKASSFKLA